MSHVNLRIFFLPGLLAQPLGKRNHHGMVKIPSLRSRCWKNNIWTAKKM